MRVKTRIALGLVALWGTGVALAGVVGYQTQASFLTASSGLGSTQQTNFDTIPINTLYATGTGPAGFTLSAAASGSTPQVRDKLADGTPLWTTSGTHFLGLNNSDAQFLGGDALTFSFASTVRAFGLYVVTGGDVIAGDLGLSAAGGGVLNSGTADVADGQGSYAYFLGLVSDVALGDVTLNFGDGSFFFTSAVDDVLLVGGSGGNGDGGTVPEPPTLALLGLAGLAWAAQQKRPSHGGKYHQEQRT